MSTTTVGWPPRPPPRASTTTNANIIPLSQFRLDQPPPPPTHRQHSDTYSLFTDRPPPPIIAPSSPSFAFPTQLSSSNGVSCSTVPHYNPINNHHTFFRPFPHPPRPTTSAIRASSSIVPLCNILPPQVILRRPLPSSTEVTNANTIADTSPPRTAITSTVDSADGNKSSTNSAFYKYSSARSAVDKSPMCRIAELARYNKKKHEYKLLDESGPAHEKIFTVSLVLSADEIYQGSGASIKKAQQNAAANAWELTKLAKPARSMRRRITKDPISPTVILQSYATHLGLTPVYKKYDLGSNTVPLYPQLMSSSTTKRRFGIRPAPMLQTVHLSLDPTLPDIIGHGNCMQTARHNAAADALTLLHLQSTTVNEKQKLIDESSSSLSNDEIINSNKSTISLVHEISLQRRMDVISESGPAHDRKYVLRCTLSNAEQTLVAEGEGNSKKQAKQTACASMIKQLAQLAPINRSMPEVIRSKRHVPRELKRKTIVKDRKMDPEYGHQINPVSRLIQVQQIKKEDEPEFEYVSENGQNRYKEFIVQVYCIRVVLYDAVCFQFSVTINGRSCQGAGPNKKLAKRACAETMLELLGYNKPMPKPGKSLLKKKAASECLVDCDNDATLPVEDVASDPAHKTIQKTSTDEVETVDDCDQTTPKRRVTFSNEVIATALPDDDGIVSIDDKLPTISFVAKSSRRRGRDGRKPLTASQQQLLATKARELLDTTTSNQTDIGGVFCMPSIDPSSSSNTAASSARQSVTPSDSAKQKLEYIAGLLKFSLSFTDFPKTLNHQHFSLVTIGVVPPQVCNGSGASEDEARENAAFNALQSLAAMSTTIDDDNDLDVPTSQSDHTIDSIDESLQLLDTLVLVDKNRCVESDVIKETVDDHEHTVASNNVTST